MHRQNKNCIQILKNVGNLYLKNLVTGIYKLYFFHHSILVREIDVYLVRVFSLTVLVSLIHTYVTILQSGGVVVISIIIFIC